MDNKGIYYSHGLDWDDHVNGMISNVNSSLWWYNSKTEIDIL